MPFGLLVLPNPISMVSGENVDEDKMGKILVAVYTMMGILDIIKQTCLCIMQCFLKAVKMIIFT